MFIAVGLDKSFASFEYASRIHFYEKPRDHFPITPFQNSGEWIAGRPWSGHGRKVGYRRSAAVWPGPEIHFCRNPV